MDTETVEKIKELFSLFGVEDFFTLQQAYTEEDQRLMKSGDWDEQNSSLLTNRVKILLEQIDPAQLAPKDRLWQQEILWFWHHHAISFAIWKRKDRELAKHYASKALELQAPDHPNRITQLLWYLVHDQFSDAKEWSERIEEEPEHTTARQLLEEYEKGEFF